jgi:hypothetical protein
MKNLVDSSSRLARVGSFTTKTNNAQGFCCKTVAVKPQELSPMSLENIISIMRETNPHLSFVSLNIPKSTDWKKIGLNCQLFVAGTDTLWVVWMCLVIQS